MAFADDYALIGSYYGGNTGALYNVERRYSNTVKEGLDINILDDETETDVEFMTQLYRNSHPQYFLGSWIIKPVVEILLHYMGYPRITSKDSKLAERLNEFYETRRSNIQQLFRELGIFGEEYVLLGYDSELDMPTIRPKNKTFVVEARYENFNNPDDLTYVSIKEVVSQVKQKNNDMYNSEKEQVTFLKIYWKEDNPAYKKALKDGESVEEIDKYKYFATLKKKVGDGSDYTIIKEKVENEWLTVPVQQFNQNRLSNDVTGYSDANGLIKLSGVYHQVFESMIDTNIYNGKPTLMFTGLADSEKFVRTTYGEIDSVSGSVSLAGSYELFGSYYLEGEANAEYLTVNNSYIEGAKEILRLLFYIFVQQSGVPEWALGAHIDGSYASTKMQSTPLIQKIESKRFDVNDAIVAMNVKLAKIIEANEGKKLFSTYVTQLEWSEPLPEDRDYILSAIDKVIPLDVLTNEKILELLDIVANPADEIKKRNKEKTKEQLKTNIDTESLAQRVMSKLNIKTETDTKEISEGEMVEEDIKVTNDSDIDAVMSKLFGEDYLEVLGLEE